MTKLKELIEARAKAIFAVMHIGPADDWDDLSADERELFLVQARATVEADRAMGYKSIKREPTGAMIDASFRAAVLSSRAEAFGIVWDAAPDLEDG